MMLGWNWHFRRTLYKLHKCKSVVVKRCIIGTCVHTLEILVMQVSDTVQVSTLLEVINPDTDHRECDFDV